MITQNGTLELVIENPNLENFTPANLIGVSDTYAATRPSQVLHLTFKLHTNVMSNMTVLILTHHYQLPSEVLSIMMMGELLRSYG